MRNWNIGGISASKRQGGADSSFTLKNADIHSDPGVLKCHQGIAVDGTGTLPTDEIVSIVEVSEGVAGQPATYHFGEGGSVWKRTRFAVWTLLGTITQDAQHGKINDAKLFNGDIYFTMQERVGKYTPNEAWSTRDEDFAVIEFDLEHPLKVAQNDIYVGHTNHIGKITPTQGSIILDAAAAANQGGTPNTVRIPATGHKLVAGDSIVLDGTANYDGSFLVVNVSDSDHFDIESAFSAETFAITDTATTNMEQKLIFEEGYVVESLGIMTRNLIIGARKIGNPVNSFISFAKVFRWDLVSNTYSTEQEIKDVGISAMIEYSGGLLLSVGMDGDLYSYDGNFARKFKRIPHATKGATKVRKNAWTSWDGQLLFGATGTKGVYSLGAYDATYPQVFNLPIVLGSTSVDSDVFSMARILNEVDSAMEEELVMSYKVGPNDFFKKLDTDLAILETETLVQSLIDKDGKAISPSPTVQYEVYPDNTNVQLYYSIDRASYVLLALDKTVKGTLTSRKIPDGREIQYKLILTPSGATTPIIEFYG
jgi:hypothetical protein